jgi:hypothetical protein
MEMIICQDRLGTQTTRAKVRHETVSVGQARPSGAVFAPSTIRRTGAPTSFGAILY